MPTQPVTFERFGGLNLADPVEISAEQACDLLNVMTDGDRLRTRPGYVSLVSALPGSEVGQYVAEFPASAGVVHLVVAGSDKGHAYDNTGTLIASSPASGSALGSIAVVGTPTATAAYVAHVGFGIRKWNGAAWSLPVTAVQPAFLAVQTADNRLVAGRTTSTTSSRVHFSDAGAPETFGVNNFVDLSPGDGEQIAGLVGWREQIFAFKRTKFYVFTGTGLSATGSPIFNYRPVTAKVGVGAAGATAQVCAGRDGVYFIGDDGVYRTTGGPAERVSRPLDYWFGRRVLPSCPTLTGLWDGDLGGASIVAFGGLVYCTLKAAGSPTTLVLDEGTGAWTIYRFTAFGTPIRVMAGCGFEDGSPAPSGLRTLLFAMSDGSVVKHDETRTTDGGAAISWYWTSGFTDLGAPGQVKVSRESRLWGSGSVTLQVGNDYAAVDTGSALALGTAPQVLDAWQQIDREGTLWQHKISGSGPGVVSRAAHYISHTKLVGLG